MATVRKIAFLLLFAARPLFACSCVFTGEHDAQKALQYSDAVFAGVVESIEDPSGERRKSMTDAERRAEALSMHSYELGPANGRLVRFRVLQIWKSESLEPTEEVWTGYGGGDCGYPFEKGQSYLVFARRTPQNRLAVGICGETSALICATGLLQELRDPIKSYESFTRASLLAREQPYTTYWRPCIEPAVLTGERGLSFDKHCVFQVDGVVTREGTLQFTMRQTGPLCPSDPSAVVERMKAWKFIPATIEGEPVAVMLNRVSMREPTTEAEHKAFLEQVKRQQQQRQKPR